MPLSRVYVCVRDRPCECEDNIFATERWHLSDVVCMCVRVCILAGLCVLM